MSKWLHRGTFVITILAILGAVCLAVLPDNVKINLAPLFRNLAAGLFLTAGVVFMAVWRLTRHWTVARAALLYLLLGTLLPATVVLRLLTSDGVAVQIEAPETRLALIIPMAVLLVGTALRSRELLRCTLAASAVVVLLVPAVLLAGSTSYPADEHHALLWLTAEVLSAAVWAGFAVQAFTLQRQASIANTAVAVFAMLAAADVTSAWAVIDSGAPHGMADPLQLCAALLAVYAALNRLAGSIRGCTDDSGTLSRALVDSEQRLADVEQQQRQRLHDASSAALGVVGASHLLADGTSLTRADTAMLSELVERELERLQGLLRTDESEQSGEFDLGTTLAAVIAMHRLDGLRVVVDLDDVSVIGHSRATSTVVDNLLRNIARHAPGARATISARMLAGTTIVTISDDGPGIPEDERRAVLLAGTRGSTARGDGHGLGLSSAAAAMAAQHGSLQVGVSDCGGTAVTLRFRATAVRRPDVAIAS